MPVFVMACAAFLCVALLVGCGNKGDGLTDLMRAADAGDTDSARKLLQEGADVNAATRDGWTPLMFATGEGHAEVANVLLDAGARTDRVSQESMPHPFATGGGREATTALALAIEGGHDELVPILLDHLETIHPIAFIAAAKGEKGPDLLQALLDAGGNPAGTTKLSYFRTPLFAAAGKGRLDNVVWLVEQGVPVKMRAGGSDALAFAVRNDELEVVRYLLSQGADPNASYHDTTMPSLLLVAIKKPQADTRLERNYQVVEVLMRAGADPYAAPKQGLIGEKRSAVEVAQAHVEEYQQYYDEETDPRWREIKKDRLDHRVALLKLLSGE